MEDTKRIDLAKPVTVAEVTYDHLDLSEPTYGQLRLANREANGFEVMGTLIRLNAKVPAAVVEGLSQRDFQQAANFLNHFSSASQ